MFPTQTQGQPTMIKIQIRLMMFSLMAAWMLMTTNLQAEIAANAVSPETSATNEGVQLDSSLQLTWAEGNDDADDAGLANQAKIDDFQQGSWSLQMYGSGTFGDDSGDMYLVHVGIGYYLCDNISVNFEGIFGAVESDFAVPDADGYAVGFDLLIRWHFCNWGDLTIFTEGGVGMIWFDENFPPGGTHQNFTPQFGVGAAYKITDGLRIMGGARWHHVSNARKSGIDRNPGFDGAMVYLGVMMPF